MKIEVSMSNERKIIQMEDGTTGEDLISKLGVSPDEVILVVNGRPIPYTSKLEDGYKIKIIQVASGG